MIKDIQIYQVIKYNKRITADGIYKQLKDDGFQPDYDELVLAILRLEKKYKSVYAVLPYRELVAY
jgi:hypothetical protein